MRKTEEERKTKESIKSFAKRKYSIYIYEINNYIVDQISIDTFNVTKRFLVRSGKVIKLKFSIRAF